MPILLIICLIGSVILSQSQNILISGIFSAGTIIQVLVYTVALFKPILPKHRFFEAISYLVSGHIAGLIGFYLYISGKHQSKWKRTILEDKRNTFSPPSVRFGKRVFDICFAVIGIIIFAPLFLVLSVLIKIDSPGPILFRQKRVGLSTPRFTNFFWMYKFRTMVQDAEKISGAIWAQKNDPRVTRIGRLMRKTRLDEIPQLWNVLIGDMSLIGPRPERPELYGKLNYEVPFFAERNYGVRPGITGLAQIHNGYKKSIEDMRNKAAYDHSYALSLCDFKKWIMGDALIIYQTLSGGGKKGL